MHSTFLTKIAATVVTTTALSAAIAIEAPQAKAVTFDFTFGTDGTGQMSFDDISQPTALQDLTNFSFFVDFPGFYTGSLFFTTDSAFGSEFQDSDVIVDVAGTAPNRTITFVDPEPGDFGGAQVDFTDTGNFSNFSFFFNLRDSEHEPGYFLGGDGSNFTPLIDEEPGSVTIVEAADTSTSVPEPASILGLLAIGAMGATSALKKKQASS
jgi:hypothetical protein